LGTNNLKGTRSSRFPEWSGYLSTTYERPLQSDWSFYTRGDLSYTGEVKTGEGNLATLDDFALINARLGIRNETVSVELYAKNLLDEDKWRGGTDFADFSVVSNSGFVTLGGIIMVPQDRRTLGV